MKMCRRYILLFWMAACLLIAGALWAHAYEAFSCERAHSEQHDSAGQECPAEHQCGQTHAHGLGLVEVSVFHSAVFFEEERYLPYLVEASEGVTEEIDYPPRTS